MANGVVKDHDEKMNADMNAMIRSGAAKKRMGMKT